MLPLSIDETTWSELLGSLPSRVTVTPTDSDNTDNSTRDTISLMDLYAHQDAQSAQVQKAVDEIRANSSDDTEQSLIDSTFEWVKEHVIFTQDEELLNKLFGVKSGTELLIKPSRLLSMHNPMGDCDDFSMLTKAILINLGIDSSLTTVAANAGHPGVWSHVYNTAHLQDGTSLAVDTSHGETVGWEAPNISRKGIWGLGDVKHMTVTRGKSGAHASQVGLDHRHVFDNALMGLGDWGDIDWENIIGPLAKAGSQVITAQYGQPQIQQGAYIRNADGSIMTTQPVTTAGYLPGAGSGIGVGVGSLLPIILVGGLALLLFSRK